MSQSVVNVTIDGVTKDYRLSIYEVNIRMSQVHTFTQLNSSPDYCLLKNNVATLFCYQHCKQRTVQKVSVQSLSMKIMDD